MCACVDLRRSEKGKQEKETKQTMSSFVIPVSDFETLHKKDLFSFDPLSEG